MEEGNITGKQIEFEYATKNTYMFQEKTFTDTVIGTLNAYKVIYAG